MALEILIPCLHSVCDAHFRDRKLGTREVECLAWSHTWASIWTQVSLASKPVPDPLGLWQCSVNPLGQGPQSLDHGVVSVQGLFRSWAAPQEVSSPWASELHLPLPIAHNCLNQPYPLICEKLSSMKLVLGAKNVGDHCSRAFGSIGSFFFFNHRETLFRGFSLWHSGRACALASPTLLFPSGFLKVYNNVECDNLIPH